MSILEQSEEASTPSTPSAGRQLIYPKAGGWYTKNSAGVEVQLLPQSIADTLYAALVGLSTQVFSVAAATAATHAIRYDQTFAIGQSYVDKTSVRSINTGYMNSTGKAIAVSVWGTGDTSGVSGFIGYVSDVPVVLGALAKTAGTQSSIYFIVPPGATYKVSSNSGTCTITNWFELTQ